VMGVLPMSLALLAGQVHCAKSAVRAARVRFGQLMPTLRAADFAFERAGKGETSATAITQAAL
jgi:hypothetical protein